MTDRSEPTTTTDYKGRTLAIGDQVEAYLDDAAITARITDIAETPGCVGHTHLTLTREDDGTTINRASDSVVKQ